ncbi:MAG: glycogen synthase [Fibrobacter sp.]|nr:glycogen synthase [Fibrobacter sp.]
MEKFTGEYDDLFQTKLDSWVLFRSRLHDAFNQKELDLLIRSERTFNSKERVIAFLSFENRFASLGGLAAVARLLPEYLTSIHEKVIFITPFHAANTSVQDAFKRGLLKVNFKDIVFHLCNYKGVLTCYEDTTAKIPTYHLKINGHFEAGDNIYHYQDDEERLLLDSLAFTAAVPYAVSRLGYDKNLLFHANDWETAIISLTSKMAVISGLLSNARTVLTLHNGFDCGIPAKYKNKFLGKLLPGDTVLQCALPFLNGPLTTVSIPFAHEIRYDPLQRGIFTDHLQMAFSMNPPVGIENGMFGKFISPFSEQSLSAAKNEIYDPIIGEKNHFRSKLVEQIKSSVDERIIGEISPFADDVPVFFMSGRLDIMQKGFDVIFHAFRKLLPGSAKLIFCPSSNGNAGMLKFFNEIVEECRGNIVIWPFRISAEQYCTFVQGSSYLLMPSFYEPFGAATEGYINGTPVIARGTGGLWLQVNPYDGIYRPEFYRDILKFPQRMEKPTGILFRENYPDNLAEVEWRELLDLPPERRPENPLYGAIVESAQLALQMAIDIFKKPHIYTSFIINGLETVKTFSWEKAARQYQKIYNIAVSRGF